MIRTAAVASLVVAAVSATELRGTKDSNHDIMLKFEEWRREFNMEFETAAEHMKRQAIFAANHARILEHNKSGATYTMAHNQFSHLTADEFAEQNIRGYIPDNTVKGTHEFDLDVESAPASKDWTTEGAVTAVKDQGQCGSCWSFSTTGALEGGYFLKNGKLPILSEQELVDCDTVDSGCNGGLMDYAFDYAKDHGLAAESAYGYTARDGTCSSSHHARELPAGAVKGYTDVPYGDEKALKAAVANAPVSVAIEADQFAFQFYSSGVMTGRCGRRLDHGVLAVGYGSENNIDFWKIKNSWGGSWGEGGYLRIQRGTSKCGVADSASYPQF